MTSADITKKLKWLIIIGISSFAVVLIIYFASFHGTPSIEQDAWGQFGDFVGGTLSPILTFLTIIALI